MKKIVLSSIATLAIFSQANAGMLLDITAGAGTWNAAPSGDMRYSGSTIDLENDLKLEKNSDNYYVYVDVDHAVPVLPNVRIERQELKTTGTANLANIQFGNQSFNLNTTTNMDLSQNDYSFYWGIPGLNLASIGMIDIGLGINVKQFDGSIELQDSTGNKEVVALNYFVPMGYASLTIDPPVIPAKFFTSYKVISYQDSGLRDFMAKVMINLPIPLPLIDFTFDLGYKEQSLKIDESLSDDINTDIKFSGMTFGISAKF